MTVKIVKCLEKSFNDSEAEQLAMKEGETENHEKIKNVFKRKKHTTKCHPTSRRISQKKQIESM